MTTANRTGICVVCEQEDIIPARGMCWSCYHKWRGAYLAMKPPKPLDRPA